MAQSIKPHSGAHNDVIALFKMPNRPTSSFCAEKKVLREHVRYALKMAFNDFNFRTLHKEESKENKDKKILDIKYKEWETAKKGELRRKSKEEKEGQEPPSVTMYLMDRLGTEFEDRFVAYFTEEPRSLDVFDHWHHETCQLFLDNLDGSDNNEEHFKIYKNLKYGKAQKIVNMMFKHLYCFKGDKEMEEKWEPYFEHCHVTMDNFTLEWFKRNVDPYQRIDSWSNLEYLEKPVDKNDYMFYQSNIRIFFEKQKAQTNSIYCNVTPFQAEFHIWPEIQLHLAAEAFIFELDPDTYKGKESSPTDKRKEIIALSVDELIARVTDEIQRYKENHQ